MHAIKPVKSEEKNGAGELMSINQTAALVVKKKNKAATTEAPTMFIAF